MTPAEIILHKNLVTHPDLTSDDWASISAGIKDRAFFSSRVESTRFLDMCRTRIAEMLANKPSESGAVMSRAQVVSDIMRAARESGIARGTERITDPGSMARANVIIDTNAGMAEGYLAAMQANTYGARLAFPAQELVRIEERINHRRWRDIWTSHGGRLYGNRMIALKEDPIWIAISRFGTPYPPFDFNSGMGLDDVSFEEAVSLGVIQSDYQPPQKSPMKSFNEKLEADCDFKNDEWTRLKAVFGDQIRQDGKKIIWRQDVIREAFNSRKSFNIKLGQSSSYLLHEIPDSDLALIFANKQLNVSHQWLDHKRKDGTDHRAHFFPLPDYPNDIPLTISDLELLPSIWRMPDKVENVGVTRLMLTMKASDGGLYKAVVDGGGDSAKLVTFYKEKESPN